MDMRILLTGATGFVGPRLLRSLRERFAGASILSWTRHAAHADNSGERQVDICSAEEVDATVSDFRPSHVVHLAAQSHVPTSFRDPAGTWQVNVMGTLYLLEAVRRHMSDATVLYVGSSEVYGRSFQIGEPLAETALLQPQNPYAASKAAADLMCGQYAGQGLRTIRLRPFNHIGAGQSVDFVASAFAAQIARIEAGLQDPVLRVGNLEAQRDFLDVEDVVRAYVMALEKSGELTPGLVLNLCSGKPRRIRDLLDMLLAETKASIRVEADSALMRPSDTPYAVGSAEAARAHLGWEPRIPLQATVRALLEDWRQVTRSSVK
jgi:GDP-4-dehydro-6-deoxy-D-mannose reductase